MGRRVLAWLVARRLGLLLAAGTALALVGFVHPTRVGWGMRLGSQEATRLEGLRRGPPEPPA